MQKNRKKKCINSEWGIVIGAAVLIQCAYIALGIMLRSVGIADRIVSPLMSIIVAAVITFVILAQKAHAACKPQEVNWRLINAVSLAALFAVIAAGTDVLLNGRFDSWGVSVIGLCVCGPLVEELFYRLFVIEHLSTIISREKAVIVSAALFGIMHGDVSTVIMAFCLGIALGIAFIYSKDIRVPFLMHAVINLFSMMINDTGRPGYMTVIIVLSTLVCAVLYHVFYRWKERCNDNYGTAL